MFGLSEEEGRQVVGNMIKTTKKLGFETPIEMQLILKAASHHAVRREFKELQDVAAKRKVDQESAELWPAQHLAEMAKAGISYTSLASSELNANDWFATFTSREKSVALYYLATKADTKTIDVSQRIDRPSSSSTTGAEKEEQDVCSTIVCHSHIWVADAARILTGWEGCLLQGIHIDASTAMHAR